MLKLIGAAMVVIACGIGGLIIATRYSQRPKELRSLKMALQIMETEVSYGLTCLPEAFQLVASRCDKLVKPLFSRAAEELSQRSGDSVAETWLKAISSYSKKSSLKQNDLNILRTLGSSLGISDRENQIRHLRLAMEQIGLEAAVANDEAAKNVKVWSYMGFLGGLTLILVLY